MRTFICLALALMCCSGPAAASNTSQTERDGTVIASALSPPGGVGWQPYFIYTVPPGKNLIYTNQCPDDAPNAVNGAFYANVPARAGLSLVSNFRPGGDRTKWEWIIDWPSGAPAQSKISFSVYCIQ
jgi:hypothetical protein